MGYTTEFDGTITITPALDRKAVDYINAFSNSRRMKRNVSKISDIDPNGVMGKFGTNDYGVDGEFFVSTRDRDDSVIDGNTPPETQPELWCQWVISEDGKRLEWDGGEKFYCYNEWMDYIINNFIAPRGNMCNGEIVWQGEDIMDMGKIVVKDNTIKTLFAEIIYK